MLVFFFDDDLLCLKWFLPRFPDFEYTILNEIRVIRGTWTVETTVKVRRRFTYGFIWSVKFL